MAFIREWRDFISFLEEHPEWRAELRRLLLTEELLQLPAIVRELAEAQKRTEKVVRQLAIQVGHLSGLIGGDIEADAEDVLLAVIKEKGLVILEEPYSIDLDGQIDVVARARDGDGELWFLVEAKVRLRRKEVLSWAKCLQKPSFLSKLASKGIKGRVFPYAFGIRIYKEVLEVAQEKRIGLLDTRGERLEPLELRI